jgi:hypothetical protein
MSADNRICILRNENGDYAVWEGSLSNDYYEPPTGCKCFESIDDAYDYAKSLALECVVLEGGIEEISKQEQIIGLTYAIEDLSSRLRSLTVTESQWTYNYN